MDGEAIPTLSDSVDKEEVIGMAEGMVDGSELATALHKEGSEVDNDADDDNDKILQLRVTVDNKDLDVGGKYKIPKKRKWDMGWD